MRRLLHWAGLVLVLALVFPAAAADDKKPDDKKMDPAKLPATKKEAAAKMIAAGEFTAKIINVESAKKSLNVEITVPYAVPNVGEMQAAANCRAQLATTRDRNTAISLVQQIQQHEANSYSIKREGHTLDIEAADDIKVRLKDPPIAFDDKGKPKRYTQAELKELKGDPKLPGFQGDFDSLRPGQIVSIKLMKMKEAPRAKPGKDTDKDLLPESKPVATLIIIMAEPATN